VLVDVRDEGFVGRIDNGWDGRPGFLDVVALGGWVITVVGGAPAQVPPQTYSGCGSGSFGARYSPLFTLDPGKATFYIIDTEGWGKSYALLDYGRNVETPLAHEMEVLGGTYLLKMRGSGCWEVSVEQ
jgi:hypothetical protein